MISFNLPDFILLTRFYHNDILYHATKFLICFTLFQVHGRQSGKFSQLWFLRAVRSTGRRPCGPTCSSLAWWGHFGSGRGHTTSSSSCWPCHSCRGLTSVMCSSWWRKEPHPIFSCWHHISDTSGWKIRYFLFVPGAFTSLWLERSMIELGHQMWRYLFHL